MILFNTLLKDGTDVNSKRETQKKKIFEEVAEHYMLGLVYTKLKKYSEAIESYKKAIKGVKIKKDVFLESYFMLGLSYSTLRKHSKAVEALKQTIRIKPEFVEAHYFLGCSLFFLKDKKAVLEEYEILKKLSPEKANELFSIINN